ncbi:helix-turn-helix domain-containing protein [Thioalkalivibrio sulfidiphilus]|uniref:helix-turn-helix domain-containing protein n=1 Tax=Thioalkalivibrio sulfidiphilus TaxID=1033854 RepID=UPI0003620B6A|nr:helix-turn-helix domain-containing protein [Thioalkalivibrio sulfidiphilus]
MSADDPTILSTITEEIRAACVALGVPNEISDEIARRVDLRVRTDFGGERPYIPCLANHRRRQALDMIRKGASPESAAKAVGVHPSTTYRWRRQENKGRPRKHGAGLGKEDWVL